MRYSEWIQKDKINTGRQQEIDLARAIPVLSLPFVHCVIECSSLESIGKPIPFFFDVVIGAPLGAPIFMFCMGISLLYTKHNSYKDMLKRELILFIAGFVLNIIRFAIPYLTGYLITGEYDKYIAPMPFKVFGNDILQFAGLAFMLLGLLKKQQRRDKIPAGVGFVGKDVFAVNAREIVHDGAMVFGVFCAIIFNEIDVFGIIIRDYDLNAQ